MVVAFESKKIKKLGFQNYDQVVVFFALAVICPVEIDKALKTLRENTILGRDRIKKVLENLISLGLVKVNDGIIEIGYGLDLILGLGETMPKLPLDSADRKENKENKEKIEVEAKPPDQFNGSVPVSEIVALYHQICPMLPRVKFITKKRFYLIKKRYQEFGLEGIKEVFQKVVQSPFLIGQNHSGWRASFDFIMKKENFYKILEDYYKGNNNKIMI